MHSGYYYPTRLSSQMDSIPTSGGSVSQLDVGVVTDTISPDKGSFRPQGSHPAGDEGGGHTWQSDIVPWNSQVSGEGYYPAEPYPSIQPTSTHGIETPHLATVHHDGSIPVVHPPSTMGQSTLSSINPSPDGFRDFVQVPVTMIQNGDSTRSTRNPYQEGTSMNVPQDQNHRDIRVDEIPNDLVPPASPETLFTPFDVQNQNWASQDQPQQFEETGDSPVATSSWSSREGDTHGSPTRRYSCDMCDNDYAQPQGLTRHQRKVHNPILPVCRHCGVFKWDRPYNLKEHLKRRHPEVNAEAEVKEIKRDRRRPSTITRYLPPESVFSPTLEYDRRGSDETHLPPPLAFTHLPPIAQPTPSLLDHEPQPEFAEPTVMEYEPENSRRFEAFDSSYARSLQFAAERFQMTTDMDMGVPAQIWDHNAQGGCTPTNPPSNPVTTTVPTLTPLGPNSEYPWQPGRYGSCE